MATFVGALATKIVKPSSATTKIALLNMSYAGANRAGLVIKAVLASETTYAVEKDLAGVTLTLDKNLSVHDSNYLAGDGLRVWLAVDVIKFRSVTSDSNLVFKLWQYDTVPADATLIKNGEVDVTFTLQDTVEVVSVKNNKGALLTKSNSIYSAVYYPTVDEKVPDTNKIKVAEIVVSGGRVHTDAPYEVYVYEDDAQSAVMPEGASVTLVSHAADNTSTLTLFYDVGTNVKSSRDLSVHKNIVLTVTDKYRSLNVTVQIVPIAAPNLVLNYVEPNLVQAGTPVYSLTDAEIDTAGFKIADLAVTNPLAEVTYTVVTANPAVYDISAADIKLKAPVTVSATGVFVVQTNQFSITENGRVFTPPVSSDNKYVVRDFKISLMGVSPNFTIESELSLLNDNFVVIDGFGPFTAELLTEPSLNTEFNVFEDTFYERDATAVLLSTIFTRSDNMPSDAYHTIRTYLQNPLAEVSSGLKGKYATFKKTLKITNGKKVLLTDPIYFSIVKNITPISKALHQYDTSIALTATKIYVNRGLTKNAYIAPAVQLLRGGQIATRSPNFPGEYAYNISTTGGDINSHNISSSTNGIFVRDADNGNRENSTITVTVTGNPSWDSSSQPYNFEWFETFDATAPTNKIILYQNESGTNVTGKVFLDATSPPQQNVFKINGGLNAVRVPNAGSVAVTVERALRTAPDAWTVWEDAGGSFTFTTAGGLASGYATITVNPHGTAPGAKFDRMTYLYRLKYDVASKAFDADQLYSQDGYLVSSTAKTPGNKQVTQEIIIEDVSMYMQPDVAWNGEYPLNFNPFGSNVANGVTYTDLSPKLTDIGLTNVAVFPTVYNLPAYQLIAHSASASGLFRVKVGGNVVAAAQDNDLFALGIVSTIPIDGQQYGSESKLEEEVTYAAIASQVSVRANSPVFYAGSTNLGKYVKLNGALKIIECESIAGVENLNIYLRNINAIATPLRPLSTLTYALAQVHAVDAGETRSVHYTRFGVLNSELVTSVTIKAHTNRSTQFPDCFRMQLDTLTYTSRSTPVVDQKFTYTLRARTIGTSLSRSGSKTVPYTWTWNGAPGTWFTVATNVGGATVTQEELNYILSTSHGRNLTVPDVFNVNVNDASVTPGWPERWVTPGYLAEDIIYPYCTVIETSTVGGITTTTFEASSWLEYQLIMQNANAYADIPGEAGYGYVSSNIIRIHDWSTANAFDRRKPTTTPNQYSDKGTVGEYPALYRTTVFDDGVVSSKQFLSMFVGPITGDIYNPTDTTAQSYLLTFDAKRT